MKSRKELSCRINPFFLSVGKSQRFVLNYLPENDRDINHTMIIVPPFAEEMNKSRQSMSLLSRCLTQCGYSVVIIDLFGTGDSDGDFGDATWCAWLDDLKYIYSWCETTFCQPISICAIRAGALLAKEFIDNETCDIKNLIFWQPVISGKNYLVQFLRLKIAADMIKSGNSKSGTKELLQMLDENQSIEVSGYLLSPELALPLSDSLLTDMPVNDATVYWLETTMGESPSVSPASAKAIDTMLSRGINIQVTPVKEQQFWQTQEITLAIEFVRATEMLCC